MNREITVNAMEITDHPALDPITVFWEDFSPGKGQVTIICYGAAWTAYWGGMSGQTVKQFFSQCNNDYLIDRLAITQFMKPNKGHKIYLGRIIDAIKSEIAEPKS
jgi:hypothetical protein